MILYNIPAGWCRCLFSNFTGEEEKLIAQLIATDDADEIGLDIVKRMKNHEKQENTPGNEHFCSPAYRLYHFTFKWR